MVLFLIAILVVLIAAYAAVWFFTNENPLATWLDEWRLSRLDLRTLDAACAANPNVADVVVTLTTIPSRIALLQPTLKSLLWQTERPKKIRICLPAYSIREQRAYTVPDWLRDLRCVEIATCDDVGPATKFLSTLQSAAPDQFVLVVDDDRIYHPQLIAAFAALAHEYPDRALTSAGWRAPADLIDRPTTLRNRLAGAPEVPVLANRVRQAQRVDIMQGVHGYAIRPRFFDLTALADFPAEHAALRYVDDVWVSAHCQAEKWIFPMALSYVDFKPWRHRDQFNASSLGGNVNRAPRLEDRGNSIALRYFADRWMR